jgi:hypothetical protein
MLLRGVDLHCVLDTSRLVDMCIYSTRVRVILAPDHLSNRDIQ